MALQRSGTERALQSLAFELGGLVLAVPIYQAVYGGSPKENLVLMVALSLAALVWNPLHNRCFDAVEYRLTGRIASDRPHGLRIVHAVSHEVTPIMLTLPLILLLSPHGLGAALALNVGLTLSYVAYAYIFYLIYDRLIPVAARDCA